MSSLQTFAKQVMQMLEVLVDTWNDWITDTKVAEKNEKNWNSFAAAPPEKN